MGILILIADTAQDFVVSIISYTACPKSRRFDKLEVASAIRWSLAGEASGRRVGEPIAILLDSKHSSSFHYHTSFLILRACRSVTPQVCLSAKEWYLQWTYRQKGIKLLRNVYQRLKSMRPISLDFFKLYVVMESSQLAPKLKLIRAAFEEALLEFGQTEPDLWLNYMQCENEVCKDAARSGEIYQRARVALDPHLKESFIRKHVMLGLVQ